ncbi:UDP-glucose 4-epimerase GalE [Streptomyces niger]|uniref:UDP-glucose 4-epimerase GalE n=1 Tax=Streptomyces niger TaxID=66373 RepID=UPI00069BB5E7|nr:UDP-glucose 4-epimerase GalE [Streptomyces niger]
MRVLVTGGAGYVGSFTVRQLLGAGHEVVVIDNLSSGRREAVGECPLEVLDILDSHGLRSVCRSFRPQAVLHFAALKSSEASLSEIDTYFRVNVTGTQNVVAAAAEADVERFIFSSSCAVYGTPQICPVDEESPIRPESPYGETKYLCERMIAAYGRATGMRYANLRYFNAAGAAVDSSLGEYTDRTTRQILPVAIRSVLGLAPAIRIFGDDYPTEDGTALRDYVHVEDLARAHVQVLHRLDRDEWSGPVNLGGGQPTSVAELLDALRKVSGHDVEAIPAARRPGDPAVSWADPGLAHRRFGWQTEYGLDDIVRTSWAWHSDVPASLG